MGSACRPPASSENARLTMRANRRVSGRELELRHALWAAGLRGYRISAPLPGRPDVAYPGAHVAVFVHGCFWHRCPICALAEPKANSLFWRDKFRENVDRDERAQSALAGMGWLTLVIWEHELREDLLGCVGKVAAAIGRGDRVRTHGRV